MLYPWIAQLSWMSELSEPIKLEVITYRWRKARENDWECVTIAFGLTSDWMKKWRECFKPIVYSVVMQIENQLLFETEIKSALRD